MIAHVLAAVAEEFSASPMRFVAELVQFLLLAGVLWVVAFGFGKRKGFVVNMLAEHGASVSEHIEWASQAAPALVEAKRAAEERISQARSEADRLRLEARTQSDSEEENSKRQADVDAERIVERAHHALENEREQMTAELRNDLVDLVSEATRTIMNEALTVAEQRERIESAITAGIGGRSSGHAAKGEHPRVMQAAAKQA